MIRMPARRRTRAAVAASVAVGALVVGLTSVHARPFQAEAAEDEGPPAAQQLPESFQWTSTGELVGPKPDAAHDIVSVKDPSVVRHGDEWLVYMTTANTAGAWSLAYTSFSDWDGAAAAPQSFLDTNPNIGTRYAAAPHVFYFAPGDEWYLVYQTGLPSYSTTDDPTDPQSWSAPKHFQDSVPDIVQDNMGSGAWLDYWVTCDDADCYLFSADDNGHLYRAETTVGEFPNGFDNTQIVLQDDRFDLFEGPAVYRVGDTDTYLLMMEAIASDGSRYYRSFTSQGLTGQWQPLADTQDDPFAGPANVSFPDGAWTRDISHGELLRAGNDQTMTIDPCNLQMLYQGRDPNSDGMDYSQLPYRLGLATQSNPTC